MTTTPTPIRVGPRWLVAVVAIGALALTGCTAEGGTTAPPAGNTDIDALIGTVDPAYDGLDAGNFVPLPEVEVVDGTSFDVGFLTLYGAQSALKAVEDAARTEVEALGGNFIAKDAQANPQTQVTQFEELITAGVDIIIGYPVVEAALAPSIQRAADAGIPFIAIGTPVDQTTEAVEGTVTSILQGYDYIVWATLNRLAEDHPGASFGVIGTALPIEAPNFIVDRIEFWGQEFGLEFVGRVDSVDDSAAGFTPAAQELLTQHPDVDILITYIDQALVSVASAVAASSNPDVLVVSPNTGADITRQALEAGQVELVFRTPWEVMGRTAARAAYSVVTEQNLPLPAVINVPGVIITPETANDVTWIGQ